MRFVDQEQRGWVTRSLSVLLFLVATETAGRWGIFDARYLPLPSMVVRAAFKLPILMELGYHLGISLARALAGFLITALIAVPLGVGMARSALFRHTVEPMVESLRAMPGAALVPAAIVLLGLGEGAKMAVIIIGSFGPLLVASYDSVRRLDPLLLDTARMLHLSTAENLIHVVLPAAAPQILSGARVSLAYAYILTITVELIFGANGLGSYLIDMQRSINYPQMYAGIFVTAGAGYLLNALFLAGERRYLRWHYEYTATRS